MPKTKYVIYLLCFFVISCQSNKDKDNENVNAAITNQNDISTNTTDTSLRRKMFSQVAICSILYQNKPNKDSALYAKGFGFIINNQYFVTCYHVFKNYDSLKVKSMIVFYNMTWNSNERDSVEVDLNYKYSRTQHDFSKHVYDRANANTDIVILKLAHKAISKIELSPVEPDSLENLYSFRFMNTDGPLALETSKYLNSYNLKEIDGVFTLSLGGIRKGSSGCPVFNSHGQIIGMNSFGWETSARLFNDVSFSPEQKNYLLQGYIHGFTASSAMTMYTMVKQYGRGFVPHN